MTSASQSNTPYSDQQIEVGDWNPLWDTMREWDPEFIEAYLKFRSIPHRNGPLEPKVKAVSYTHLTLPTNREV